MFSFKNISYKWSPNKAHLENKNTNLSNGLLDSEGEGESGMIWENGNSNMYTVM